MADTKGSDRAGKQGEDAFSFDPQRFMDMNPFGADPTKFFEAWTDMLKNAQTNSGAWADMARAPGEVAEFTMARVRKTMELSAELTSARTPNDVVEALSKASSAAVADYQQMAERMLARFNASKD